MATSAQALIEAAFARSTSSDAGKLAVDGEMLAHLNRKYQSLFARYSVKSGDNAIARSTLTWAGSPVTVSLPTDIVDIVKIETATAGKTYLIPVREKDRIFTHLAPAFYRQGNSLASRGAAGDPSAADVYTIWYKDAPATLSTLATNLDARFPVRFETLLIVDLALYLSVKDEGRNPAQIQSIRDELTREEAAFAVLIGESNTAKDSAHPSQAGTQA